VTKLNGRQAILSHGKYFSTHRASSGHTHDDPRELCQSVGTRTRIGATSRKLNRRVFRSPEQKLTTLRTAKLSHTVTKRALLLQLKVTHAIEQGRIWQVLRNSSSGNIRLSLLDVVNHYCEIIINPSSTNSTLNVGLFAGRIHTYIHKTILKWLK